MCLRCLRWVRTSLAVGFCILAARQADGPENRQQSEEILTEEPETHDENEKKLVVHTISDSMKHGAWSMPWPFSWYMLHAIQAENSQEHEEILTEEREENEKKLAETVPDKEKSIEQDHKLVRIQKRKECKVVGTL